jgi:hypothetical protein
MDYNVKCNPNVSSSKNLKCAPREEVRMQLLKARCCRSDVLAYPVFKLPDRLGAQPGIEQVSGNNGKPALHLVYP